jgi:hypothetical protein
MFDFLRGRSSVRDKLVPKRKSRQRVSSLNRSPPKARRELSLNRNPPKGSKSKSKSKSKSRSRTEKIGSREFPPGIGNLITSFARPTNAGEYRPSLKIMETENVYKWIDQIFGREGRTHVVKDIQQKGEYQIIQLNPLKGHWYNYLDHWDEFYFDLDKHGALWIQKVSDQEFRRIQRRRRDGERQPTEGGIQYETKPHPGYWQIQYASEKTPHRIFDTGSSVLQRQCVEVQYKLYGQMETGYKYKGERPQVEMTPLLPKSRESESNEE